MAFRHQKPPPNGHHSPIKMQIPHSIPAPLSRFLPQYLLLDIIIIKFYYTTMSGSSSVTLTIEELSSFHSIDRQIYSWLVINLGRDIMESMHVIALWLWLEELGYPNIVIKLLTLPNRVINRIADEAVLCLRYLQSEIPPPPPPLPLYSSTTVTEIPGTQELMEGRQISLSVLHEHRPSALQRIAQTVNDVWPRAFHDITLHALANRANSSSSSGGGFRPAFQPPSVERL